MSACSCLVGSKVDHSLCEGMIKKELFFWSLSFFLQLNYNARALWAGSSCSSRQIRDAFLCWGWPNCCESECTKDQKVNQQQNFAHTQLLNYDSKLDGW